ncbi:MAG: hypothetical protein RMN53_14135 [Anaerolineae bacterium]|nr:hypothetical protein [Anaerolineae bacterium]
MSGFVGDWLVSEYVYTPAGEYVGRVRQQRRLEPADGGIRVVQVCRPIEPAPGLSPLGRETAAVMDRRVGEFVFDLALEGRARRYLGPDVVGGGVAWAEGVLTARGLWPRFGFNFTSFSILLGPTRQVTGGRFFAARREVAVIVGVAGPGAAGYPALPPPTPRTWAGLRCTFTAQGELLDETRVAAADLLDDLRRQAPGWQGCGMAYGPLLEAEGVAGPGETVSLLAVNDAKAGLVGLARWQRDELLHRVQVYRLLEPVEGPP